MRNLLFMLNEKIFTAHTVEKENLLVDARRNGEKIVRCNLA